jgi:outer membrane pore protein E
MNMKKISAVAISVFIASQANAAPVVNTDSTTLDLGGRIYAGEVIGQSTNATEKSDPVSAGGNNYFRLKVSGATKITDTMQAIGVYEAQLSTQNQEKIIVDSTGNIAERLAYAGIKDKNFGTVTFGRQTGSVATIAAFTDVMLTDSFGNNGLGIKGDEWGTYRGNDIVKYTGTFDKLQWDVNYKFRTTSQDTDYLSTPSALNESPVNAAAYGTALNYSVTPALTLAVGYNEGLTTRTDASNSRLLVAGIKYDDKTYYAALTTDTAKHYSCTYTSSTSSWDDTKCYDMTGLETVAGYNFTNGLGLLAGYNYQHLKNTPMGDINSTNYYTAGVVYKFNPNFRISAEYLINNKANYVGSSSSYYSSATAYDYKNELQLGARYDF